MDPDAPANPPDARRELDEVRRVLVGPETQRLDRLDRTIADRAWHTRNVAAALPDAISLRTEKDDRIARALAPTIESSIRTSVQRNPRPLVDAMSPVMGPAIRKSIGDALQGFIQSFNETLGSPFSREGLSCLFESLRTGQTYGAVRLKRSLVYRVEQVFLIHRETGLVLQHLVADRVQAQDADMVSGMMTAIRDFAKDSFGVQEGSGLDTFRIGDLTVWVEQGPSAILAAVIRGVAPHSFRATIQEAFERIVGEQSANLAEFQGDASPFVAVRPVLEACLKEEARTQRQGRSFPFFTVALLVLVPLLVWLGLRWWSLRALVSDFLVWTKTQPGYVVTEVTSDRASGKPLIVGLRDTNAAPPAEFFKTRTKTDESRIVTQFEPYYSLEPQMVLRRSIESLAPPKGDVELRLDSRPGQQGRLVATGAARHRWLLKARASSATIPGVTAYDDREVRDLDLEELRVLKREAEGLSVRFVFASSELAPQQDAALGDMAGALFRLSAAARRAGIDFQAQVVGHTDSSGQEERNVRLSRDRADRVIALLVARGVQPGVLGALGVGPADPRTTETSDRDREQNRRATLRVLFLQQPLFMNDSEDGR